jgi:hypothetical protein
MITKGHYQTKGGYHARVDIDFNARGGIAVISELGRYVGYLSNGEFAYKDEDYSPDPNPGDTFDLIVENDEEPDQLCDGPCDTCSCEVWG